MSVPAALKQQVEAWVADDPDTETQTELRAVLAAAQTGDAAALADLEDRFSGRLEFGTAGLRGEIAAGPNRMNRSGVIAAAAGLAAPLPNTAGTGTAVIGFDARHKSDVYARDTAEVMRGAGFDAVLLPRPLPTPLLAF